MDFIKKGLILFCIGGFALFTACEEVVTPDLETASPRLVIDARVNLFKTGVTDYQSVKLSLTKPFYQENDLAASNATVVISDASSNQFTFTESSTNPGLYEHFSFTPVLNETYTLAISYDGEQYVSSPEQLIPNGDIDDLLVTDRSFGGDDEENLTITLVATEPAGLGDFYMWEAYWIGIPDTIVTFQVADDEFVDGSYFDDYPLFFNDLELEVGDEIRVHQTAISEEAFDYYFLLYENIYSGGSDTTPASPSGNVRNVTNKDDKPLGYFRVGQVESKDITIYQP